MTNMADEKNRNATYIKQINMHSNYEQTNVPRRWTAILTIAKEKFKNSGFDGIQTMPPRYNETKRYRSWERDKGEAPSH